MKKILMLLMLIASCATFAADFTLTDVQGKPVSLSHLKGRWVLVNFYANWCPVCWSEVSEFNVLAQHYRIAVIGIEMDSIVNDQNPLDQILEHKMHYTYYVNGGSRFGENPPTRQIGPAIVYPTTYLFSPAGEKVKQFTGPITKENVLEAITQYSNRTN